MLLTTLFYALHTELFFVKNAILTFNCFAIVIFK